MLMKILTLLRVAMTQDLPEVLEGTVEVDESHLGGRPLGSFFGVRMKSQALSTSIFVYEFHPNFMTY